MLEFRFGQENLLTKLMDSIKHILELANFECNSTGLSMQGMDPSHQSLVSLLLRSQGFNHYRSHRDFKMGLDFQKLAQMLQCAGTDDIVTINPNDAADSATFVLQSLYDIKVSDFEMELLDTKPDLQVPEFDFDAVVQMPSSEFARICKYLNTIGDTVEISVTKEGLKFSTKGDTGTVNIVCRQNTCVDKPEEATIIKMESPVSLKFSLMYLNDFTKATPLANQVTLRLASEVLIEVEYNIAETGYLRFHLVVIAPKDKDDDEMGGYNPKRVVAKKQEEDKNMARPMKRSKSSESNEYSTTSSCLPEDKNIDSLGDKSSQFHNIRLEKLRKEKLSQEAIEREDFKILVTNTDHLTGPALLAAEFLKEKIAKKYGV